jgi:hypothetical protein
MGLLKKAFDLRYYFDPLGMLIGKTSISDISG